jgi:hypothetical protein
MISDTELYQVFQREYPDHLGHITRGTKEELPYDLEAGIVSEKFQGQRWENIEADVLRECFDVVFILNARAFYYFFPAFIRQSQLDVDKTSLLVSSLIDMLADAGVVQWPESLKDVETQTLSEYPELAKALASIDQNAVSAWRQERWKLFTQQQWALVRKWLNCINNNERWEVDRDVLRKAIMNADNWQIKGGVP